MKKFFVFMLLLCSHFSAIFAQKPPILTANASAYNTARSIAENFNAGRRFEETNLGLPVGVLGNMTLPTNYSTLSVAQKALVLVNLERRCRNGVNYGTGALVLKPFQGVETHLSDVSQGHADWLVAQNKFEHCGNPVFGTGCSVTNSSPVQRVQGNPQLVDGWERSSQNVGLSLSSMSNSLNLTLSNEMNVYAMIYRDAPTWGHRDNFLQAYIDNSGDAGQEGFLGVGEKLAANYNPFNTAGMSYGKVMVYDVYDPKAGVTNAFSVLPLTLDTAKYYRIIAKHNNKVMSLVNTSTTSGAAIVQTTLSTLATQKWKIVPTSNGYNQLISLHSGQALDVRWGGKKQGTRINQWASNSVSSSQEWKLEPAGNGYIKIINRNSGQALSVPIGSNIENLQLVQLASTGFYSQLWQLVEVNGN